MRSAAMRRSTASSRSNNRNHSRFQKTAIRAIVPSHRIRTGGEIPAGNAMATVSRPTVSPRVVSRAPGATARRARGTAAVTPPAGAEWVERAVDGRRLRERMAKRRTTASTPRSSTFGPPRTGASRTKIPRCRPTTTAKIGDQSMMPRSPLPQFLIRSCGIVFLVGIVLARDAAGQGTGALVVDTEATPGPYFVGQGFEVRVRVVAGGLRPKIEPPRMTTAQSLDDRHRATTDYHDRYRLGRGPGKPVRGPVSRAAQTSGHAGNPRDSG